MHARMEITGTTVAFCRLALPTLSAFAKVTGVFTCRPQACAYGGRISSCDFRRPSRLRHLTRARAWRTGRENPYSDGLHEIPPRFALRRIFCQRVNCHVHVLAIAVVPLVPCVSDKVALRNILS